jgi:di/tricarboxylate transporter
VLVLSQALTNAGLVDVVANALGKAGDRVIVQIVLLSGVVPVASALMNNVGALAVVLPVAIRVAREHDRSPSLCLMPMALASLLGGLTALIGTPANMIIATLRADATGVPFTMFDFAPVGVVVALGGFALAMATARWLVPDRGPTGTGAELNVEEHLTEVRVPDTAGGPDRVRRLTADHEHVVEAHSETLPGWVDTHGLELVGSSHIGPDTEESGEVELAEIVVLPESSIENSTPSELAFRRRFGVNLLAVSRKGTRIRKRLADVRFQAGDVLLEAQTGGLDDSIQEMGPSPREPGPKVGPPSAPGADRRHLRRRDRRDQPGPGSPCRSPSSRPPCSSCCPGSCRSWRQTRRSSGPSSCSWAG